MKFKNYTVLLAIKRSASSTQVVEDVLLNDTWDKYDFLLMAGFINSSWKLDWVLAPVYILLNTTATEFSRSYCGVDVIASENAYFRINIESNNFNKANVVYKNSANFSRGWIWGIKFRNL